MHLSLQVHFLVGFCVTREWGSCVRDPWWPFSGCLRGIAERTGTALRQVYVCMFIGGFAILPVQEPCKMHTEGLLGWVQGLSCMQVYMAPLVCMAT
jgi:hypothetical protein